MTDRLKLRREREAAKRNRHISERLARAAKVAQFAWGPGAQVWEAGK